MTQNFSINMKAEVLGALDDNWRPVRNVWHRIGQWAPDTVRTVLRELAREGRCEMRRIDVGDNQHCEYRRIPEAT